jgi:GNAT superfamily N-acetyltransferase
MWSIRPALASDIPAILHLIRQLAVYEREPDAVKATEADLLRDGFGERPHFECLIAEDVGTGGKPQTAGFALYFTTYSTWRGRPGIHLEDLFVVPEFRRRGIGRALLQRVTTRAIEKGCDYLGWHVLDWNQPAIDFYELLGARFLNEWGIMRISGGEFLRLAEDPTAGEGGQ